MATYCGSGSGTSSTPNVTVNNCNSNNQCCCGTGSGSGTGTGTGSGSGYGPGSSPIGDPSKPGSSAGSGTTGQPKGSTGDTVRKLPTPDCTVLGAVQYGQAEIDYRTSNALDLKDALLNTAVTSALIEAGERAKVKSVQFTLQGLGYLATNVGVLGIPVPIGGRPEDLTITYEGSTHVVNHNDGNFPSGGPLGNECAYYDQVFNCLASQPITLGGQLQGGNKLLTPNHNPPNENDPSWVKCCLQSVVVGSGTGWTYTYPTVWTAALAGVVLSDDGTQSFVQSTGGYEWALTYDRLRASAEESVYNLTTTPVLSGSGSIRVKGTFLNFGTGVTEPATLTVVGSYAGGEVSVGTVEVPEFATTKPFGEDTADGWLAEIPYTVGAGAFTGFKITYQPHTTATPEHRFPHFTALNFEVV
jgi:hypothetical protein